jgi:FtsX-like permease family
VLAADHNVASWSGVYFDSIRLDGRTVPIMGGKAGARVVPPLLSGHALDARDQVVLGPTSLAELHKHVGDTVAASYGASAPTPLRIVGTATMPAVGPASQLHLSMGTGALVDYRRIPASVLGVNGDSSFAPNAYFIRLRAGADVPAARRALQRAVTHLGDGSLSVLSVQRPAEIVNYRSMGRVPALLGTALAVGAAVALALTLIASVRRRRRDLALLKALGFTHRQLAAVVAWQSSVAVAIGTIIGIPVGIFLGRGLWNLFAHELHVVPEARVPSLTLLLVAVSALLLANIVAAIPGRQAARTPTALVLQGE